MRSEGVEMQRFVCWLRSLVAWRDVRFTGGWLYRENSVTGKRMAIRNGGYQPLDLTFLRKGDIIVDNSVWNVRL